jgi:hypothetical protein
MQGICVIEREERSQQAQYTIGAKISSMTADKERVSAIDPRYNHQSFGQAILSNTMYHNKLITPDKE